MLHAEGSHEVAEKMINETIKYYEEIIGKESTGLASLYNNKAVIAQSQGKYTEADQYFALSEKMIKNSNKKRSLSHAILTSNRALLYNEIGQYCAKVRPSILKFYASAAEIGQQNEQLLTDMYDLHLKTKGILMSSSTKIREEIIKSDNVELKNTFVEWRNIKEDLLLYYTYSKAQLSEKGINLQKVEAKANVLEKKLSSLSAEFAQSNKLSTTMAQVKSKLKAVEAVIEMINYLFLIKYLPTRKLTLP